ncbi:MAG: T9SS type A sorting domain-containing protein, partial [Paludibacter sp.]|nr:T9SS type A sorting domain-containing protein [Paludibacter sp.]
TETGPYLAYFDDFLIEESHNTANNSIISNESVYSLFYHPVEKMIQLKMHEAGAYEYKLYTASGICVVHNKSNLSIETIYTHRLGAGVYVLQLIVNDKIYNSKIRI